MSADNSPQAVEARSRLHATLEDLVREHGGSAVLWQLTVVLADEAHAAAAEARGLDSMALVRGGL